MSEGEAWFCAIGGEQKGPFTREQVQGLLAAGSIDAHTKVWSADLAEWTSLYLTALRPILGDGPVIPPSLPVQEPKSPVEAQENVPSALTGASEGAKVYPLRDNRVLSKALCWLLWFYAAVSIFTGIRILRAPGGIVGKYTTSKAFENDSFLLAMAGIGLLIVAAVFLFWKYRSTENLFRLRGPQTITPAGAVYWYFVPVAFLWKPYEAMRNLYRGYGAQASTSLVLPLWWLLFWASNLAAVLSGAIFPETPQTLSQAQAYVWWDVASYALEAIGSYVAAMLVSSISQAEEKALRPA
jgi:hypothetical protein